MLQVIEIVPGIFEKDFQSIEKKVKLISPFVDWIHIDIADGKFVPNTSLLDPAPFKELISQSGKDFELHMMVNSPFSIAKKWIDAGFNRLIMHIESLKHVDQIKDNMTKLKDLNQDLQIGIAVDYDTDVETVFPFLEAIDSVLIMTIKAGFSGQTLIPKLLEKVAILRKKKYYLSIEVDGGINDETAGLAIEAGAKRLVSTSYLFKSKDVKKAIWTLKNSNISQS
jgi:ribulose-phosphate 3-epimerase